MPLLTIIVPAYNAQEYLRRALDPLVETDGDFEVLVIDDGSSDSTADIADGYALLDPRIRVIRQENRGHGGAINTGLTRTSGTYVRVLDADDWLDAHALASTLSRLTHLEASGGVDALFTNYVHDRLGKSNRITRFDSTFPENLTFGWEQTERFSKRQYLMMHAIVFRTEIVRRSGLVLPEHTFYVDSLYVLTPLALVRTMHYLPVDLYHYFIGRSDQSVDARVMLDRVDQQLRVNRLALSTLPTVSAMADGTAPAQLTAALFHYIEAMCAVTSATLARGGTRAHLEARQEFWSEIRHESPWVYARLRRSLVATSSNLPGQAGRKMTSLVYGVARRVVGFS